jgi:hypothetical protein
VSVTRGPDLVGEIFGSAGFTFTAQPGEYSINVLARPAAGADYGTWGFSLVATAPAPVLTLTATPESTASGGTTSLQWSASNATTCTASGGWSGTKPAAGTETTAAITATTTYTLACSGPGGTSSKSTTVSISASGGAGGGGRFDLATIFLLCAMTGLSLCSGRARCPP